MTKITDNELDIVDNGRLLANNYILGSKFKNKTTEKTINVFREKEKGFRLYVAEGYEEFFNIIDVNSLEDIYKIEYRFDHYLGFKTYIVLRGQREMVVKNIKDRYNNGRGGRNMKVELKYIF